MAQPDGMPYLEAMEWADREIIRTNKKLFDEVRAAARVEVLEEVHGWLFLDSMNSAGFTKDKVERALVEARKAGK